MTDFTHTGHHGHVGHHQSLSARHRRELWEYRLLFAVGFSIFLLPAIAARLTNWKWRPWPPAPEGQNTVFGEVKYAVNTFIPFAFMG